MGLHLCDLQENAGAFEDYDLIIPMPTYIGRGGRARDHTADIIEWAAVEDDSWPFRTDVMRKTAATPPLAHTRGLAARAEVADTQIRAALEVTAPGAVADASILVFDDVFTTGHTLRAVAQVLRQHGARQVSGVVLARQPYSAR